MFAHCTKNATKTMLVRLAMTATATAAVFVVAVAPASAINQDPGGTVPPAASPGSSIAEPSGSGVDATSATLGALGGIALGGAGLAITLGVQRRRDHTTARPA